jgi:hypothetical protein
MAKKKATKKKASPKKKAAKKKATKVVDEPVQTAFYKLGDMISGFDILEAADARTKKKDPMPFDIQWETDKEVITLHILGAVTLSKKKK